VQKRFRTTEWFTEEDQRHPERYFELAERMPELNRAEERRDALQFFLAYREKLRGDLDTVKDPDEQREILAAIGRYDDAIARLRELLETQTANPPPHAATGSTPLARGVH
jgi:hypothetical protein